MSGTLASLIDEILAEVPPPANPYLAALADGSFSKDDFFETQVQFHAAVTFFSRPMAALAAKIPDAAMRVEIVRNVWEEHGEGERGRMHGATFVSFLSRLSGLSDDRVMREIARRPLWPEVRAFNTLLVGACVLDDHLVGAGTMGIVERMFSEISSLIGRAVVARGFLPAEQLIHYNLHESLDVRHAKDFFDVLAPAWNQGERERYLIAQGLRMGAMAFDQLYARLYLSRARRWSRDDAESP